MPKRKSDDKLMEKVAALLNRDVEEIKELRAVYSQEEQIYEAQSVLNYYEWRKRPEQQHGEPKHLWEKRLQVWKHKTCEGCKQPFAYSLHYDGVKYCSLDCLRMALHEMGLELTPYRPLNLRWGHRYPGIVPSSALAAIELAVAVSDGEKSDHEQSDLPKFHDNVQSEAG